jgi:drug/metabolite transporter (DMT)-like permease
MSQFAVGNMFLGLSVLLGAGAQVVLKRLMLAMGGGGIQALTPVRLWNDGLLSVATAAGAMLIAGFLFWLASLSRLDLSYAYPVACTSALLVAVFSALFLNETVTLKMIAGTILMVAGAALLVSAH